MVCGRTTEGLPACAPSDGPTRLERGGVRVGPVELFGGVHGRSWARRALNGPEARILAPALSFRETPNQASTSVRRMSNAKPATSSKGSKKGGKGEAPEPPALDAVRVRPTLARAFSNAWTVDLTRASADTTSQTRPGHRRRAEAPPESVRARARRPRRVRPAARRGRRGHDARLEDAEGARARASPGSRASSGVGHRGARAAPRAVGRSPTPRSRRCSRARRARWSARRSSRRSSATRRSAPSPARSSRSRRSSTTRRAPISRCSAPASARSTRSTRRRRTTAGARCSTAPDVTNPRAVWLAKIAFEQMEAHKADVDDLAPVVFPLIKLPKAAAATISRPPRVRYAGLTRDHYLALLKYVADKDDAQVARRCRRGALLLGLARRERRQAGRGAPAVQGAREALSREGRRCARRGLHEAPRGSRPRGKA